MADDDIAPDGIRYTPRVSSDLAFGRKHQHPCSVFFISDSSGTKPPFNYRMEDHVAHKGAADHFQQQGFDVFTFTPYSTKTAFKQFYPDIPLQPTHIQAPSTQPPDSTQISTETTPPCRNNPPPLPFVPPPTPQQHTPPPTGATPPITPVTAEAQFLQFLQQLTNQQQAKAVFPTWYGTDAKKAVFLECIKLFKLHSFFTAVTDWSLPQPHLRDLAIMLRSDLLSKLLPSRYVHAYINNPKYDEDGFAMLQHFLDKINPDSSTNKL
jgi:hypothetical protein